MQTIIVKKSIAFGNPWAILYTITGCGNPAGDVYDLKSGDYLALCNTQSTGYRRKIFKSEKSASAWVERTLRQLLPCENLVFEISL